MKTINRLLTIIVVALFVAVTFFSTTPNQVSASTARSTSLIGETENVVLFNYTFTNEQLGKRPDLGYKTSGVALNHTNVSITSAEPDGWDNGKVFSWSQEGLTNTSDIYAAAYIGHHLEGVVYFSYSVNIESATTIYPWDWTHGYVSIALHAAAAVVTPINANFGPGNETHGYIYLAGGGALVKVEYDTWHRVTEKIDIASDTIEWYVDGVLEKTQAFGYTYISYVNFMMNSHVLNDTQELTVLFDDFEVSVPKDEFRTIPDPVDTRTAMALIFDDGYQSLLDIALPILGDEPATTALLTYYTSKDLNFSGVPVLNWSEAQTLVDAGWEMMSHSHTHALIATLPDAEMRVEFSKSKDWIEANLTDAECRGFIYPASSRNTDTDTVAYEYFEYLRRSGDIEQRTLNTKYKWYGTELENWGFFTFGSLMPALIYGYHGFIGSMAHNIKDSGFTEYDIGTDAFDQWITRLRENNTRFVTPAEYYLDYRNGEHAILSAGGSNAVTITYPDDIFNRTYDSVWFKGLSGTLYSTGTHYLDAVGFAWNNVSAGTFIPGITIASGTYPFSVSVVALNVQLTVMGGTVAQWTVDSEDTISYSIIGLPDYGYKVSLNDILLLTDYGPSFSFSSASNGEFEIIVWNTKAVSTLVVLTVNMVGLGIILGVVGNFVVPIARDIQKGKAIKPEQVTRDMIKTVVFIIVGCVMWVILHAVAIG